jgi:hypothetical protein
MKKEEEKKYDALLMDYYHDPVLYQFLTHPSPLTTIIKG